MKKPKSGPRPKLVNTRKAVRKEKRQQKKIHRQEHYNKKKLVGDVKKFEPGKFVKLTTVQHESSKKDKKKNKKQPLFLDILNKERQKDMNVTEKLKSEMEEQRKQMLLKANEDEDKVIKKLEKQLGLNKSKNKNNYFADDGLDYLLEICDRTTSEQIVAAEKHLADVGDSDFEEDLAMVTGKELPKEKVKSKEKTTKIKNLTEYSKDGMGSDENSLDCDDDDDGSNKDEDFSDMENVESDYESEMSEDEGKNQIKPDKKEKIVSENDLNKVFSDDEVSHISGDSEDGFDSESGKETPEDCKTKEKPDVWEDIYGRKRDKDGNIIKEEKGVYIPPHLRNKDSTSEKDLEQLKRQIKSILNKVSGSNLHWACASLESLYSSHSRRAVSGALCAQWVCAAVPHAAAPDRLLAEHAALLALLHANVATEVGAYFLEELCLMFDKMVDSELPVEDKRLDNLTACLAYLYSFKIFHSGLMYDILYRLLHEISEKRCECAVRALRCAGPALRREDPAALKAFIHDTHAKVANFNDKAAAGSRIKFLLEVLLAVKNNNLSKIPQYEPTYAETLRKTCRSILRPGHTVTTLNIRLEDLLRAEERGKWWIVGSAWAGSRPPPSAAPSAPPAAAPAADHKLLELARKQRMNTDVRRNIFCVIMSAQDYLEALERLQALALRGPQRREAAHVALACCLQERAYNRYYALLAAALCRCHRHYQLAFQFSIWDKIKELESASKQVLTNLAQLLVHLIMEKALPLSILKIIQFSDLNKKSVRFMRQILLAVIMNADLQLSLEVFHRISKSPKLHMFRESLRLFIQHFLIKNAGKKSTILSEDEMATLKERASEVDKILTLHESKLMF